jgi:hypothetical protein
MRLLESRGVGDLVASEVIRSGVDWDAIEQGMLKRRKPRERKAPGDASSSAGS